MTSLHPRRLWLCLPGAATVVFALASIALPVGSDGLGRALGRDGGPGTALAQWARDLHDGFWHTTPALPAAEPITSVRALAVEACRRGQAERAVALYRRIGVRDWQDSRALDELADYLVVSGEYDRAEWYVREADMLLGGGTLRNNLAWHYTQTNRRPTQALGLALSAVTADRDACTVDTLAWAYYRCGRIDDAVRTAGQTLAFHSAGSDGWEWQEHQAQESSRRLLQLIRLDPDVPTVAKPDREPAAQR